MNKWLVRLDSMISGAWHILVGLVRRDPKRVHKGCSFWAFAFSGETPYTVALG